VGFEAGGLQAAGRENPSKPVARILVPARDGGDASR
jgi:hypothetical protein